MASITHSLAIMHRNPPAATSTLEDKPTAGAMLEPAALAAAALVGARLLNLMFHAVG